MNFPTTPRIRKRWLMRRFIELACFFGLMLFIVTQVGQAGGGGQGSSGQVTTARPEAGTADLLGLLAGATLTRACSD